MIVNRGKNGFTLIELCFVLMIIMIVSAVVIINMDDYFEHSDAEVVRSVVANMDMALAEGISRGISILDLQNPSKSLPAIVELAGQGYSDEVVVKPLDTGKMIIEIGTPVKRTASVNIENNSTVKVISITGFNKYKIVDGDLTK